MPQLPIDLTIETDRTDGFGNIRGTRDTNRQRIFNLIIKERGDHFWLQVQSTLLDPFEEWEDEIPLTKSQLWGAIQPCRQKWHDEAVYFNHNGTSLLQNQLQLDLSQRTNILSKLACAGKDLFRAIFFPVSAGSKGKYRRLNAIGEALRSYTEQDSMWIRVTSDCFFAPWNLMYSAQLEPDGSDAKPEGFWGYRHLFEHAPTAGNISSELKGVSPLYMALHLDERIDVDLGLPVNSMVEELLERYSGITVLRRSHSRELAKALSHKPIEDHLIYFCCHALMEGDESSFRIDEGCLTLTDDVRIKPGDILRWMDDNCFDQSPIVFLNACQGGQINSIFYQGFADVFLGKGASAVIGPQTEIPGIFAGKFAQRFLEEFFKAERKPLGAILFDLRREFFDDFNNPLGLLYSLYRGADVYLANALPKRQPEPVT